MALKFLVVDDSSIVRKVLRRTLDMTTIHYEGFVEVGDGKQALDALGQGVFDLVFLDINMPVMNGIEFMERLRADPLKKDLPVVVISTEGSKERIDRLKELGIKAYLRKPTTPEALVACLQDVLSHLPQK